jgi:hypothetical protein
MMFKVAALKVGMNAERMELSTEAFRRFGGEGLFE